jgi:phosphatidylserine/phosphatidylglycerophosphate/cardiolipin synthase-like enzyme
VRRTLNTLLGVGLTASLLVGCSTVAAKTPTPAACTGTDCVAGPGAPDVRIFVEPEASAKPIVSAIASATRAIWLEVYLLTDTAVIHALEEAAGHGVDVQVLLDTSPYGGGGTSAQETLAKLAAAGVQAKAANPAYRYTHEKAMIVDGATAYIMTCNLTASGLGGSSQTANREYGAIDTNPTDVAEVAAIFWADWDRTTPRLVDPNLVVSPLNARAKLENLIGSARRSLDIEDEEMLDPETEEALVVAARRGVAVEVVLPAPSSGAPPSTDVSRLARGGVQVRYSVALYMHAKLIVVDGIHAFVGSVNFSATSLDENRELGILIADPDALATLIATFGTDWSDSTAYA